MQREVYHIVVIQIICGNQEQNGTYIHLANIPNSTNSVFEYNQYIGKPEIDDYIVKFAIVSNKERETILKHWDEIQNRNELQFEQDYIASVRRKESREEAEEEEQ